jgi:hypothetical protein
MGGASCFVRMAAKEGKAEQVQQLLLENPRRPRLKRRHPRPGTAGQDVSGRAPRIRWQRWIVGARGRQTGGNGRRGLPWPHKRKPGGQTANLPKGPS